MDTIETIHVYLDSQSARNQNGTYSFQIQPPIAMENDEDCFVHLQSLTALHNHNNITDLNFGIQIGNGATQNFTIDDIHYSSAEELVAGIENAFFSFTKSKLIKNTVRILVGYRVQQTSVIEITWILKSSVHLKKSCLTCL